MRDELYVVKRRYKTVLRSNFVDRGDSHQTKKQSRAIAGLVYLTVMANTASQWYAPIDCHGQHRRTSSN